MGKLYVISAPSGAGKTTINRRLLEKRPDLSYSVSHTTRTPRPGEEDGRDYFFITQDQFRSMIDQGAFLEWAEVFGRYYGTARAWVDQGLGEGRDILADVDIEGARQIKANFPGAVLLFVVPPSLKELRRRLMSRHTETEEQLRERLSRASLEIKASGHYDYLIVNDDLEVAVDDIMSLMRAESIKVDQFKDFWPRFYSETDQAGSVMAEVIGGINPVLEALKARGETFQRLYLAKGRTGAVVHDLLNLASLHRVKVERVERSRLDQLYGASGHQGVVAVVGVYGYSSLDEILARCPASPALILVLDGIQDPMNLGSLIRSADGAGASGVVVPRERAAPLTPAAIKASAGASEHIPVARETNLARTLERLKDEGFWIVGTEADAPQSLYEVTLPDRLALVIGGEGRGVRRLVKEKCDLLVSIPLHGRISSLNAAVAGALAMFEYVRQCRQATT